MKTLLLVLALPILLTATPARADQTAAAVIARQFPGVLATLPDNGGNLWVMVEPAAGATWNSLAAQICLAVRPAQARIFLVKVVDIASTRASKKSSDWKLLGGANCSMVQQ